MFCSICLLCGFVSDDSDIEVCPYCGSDEIGSHYLTKSECDVVEICDEKNGVYKFMCPSCRRRHLRYIAREYRRNESRIELVIGSDGRPVWKHEFYISRPLLITVGLQAKKLCARCAMEVCENFVKSDDVLNIGSR